MDLSFLEFMLMGFVAQFIDGALGMAYGVTAMTFLLSVGVPPVAASASVHSAEVATTLASGLSHLAIGNIDTQLFRRLIIPGMAGAITGAYLLSVATVAYLEVVIAVYLGMMGAIIFWKGLRKMPLFSRSKTHIRMLGFAGGFFDTAGGGGWGSIVSSTLLAKGHVPCAAGGTVSMAEFFVALSASATFFLTIGIFYWKIVLGLLSGGLIAAPLAAYSCRKIPPRILMLAAGLLVMGLSFRTLYRSLP